MQETRETRVWSLGWEDPLEEEMAAHFGILVGKITGERRWATVYRVTKTWARLNTHPQTVPTPHPENGSQESVQKAETWVSTPHRLCDLGPWTKTIIVLCCSCHLHSDQFSLIHLWQLMIWKNIHHSLRQNVFFFSLCCVTQSCLTLCNPMDCIPPGPWDLGILQARTLE